MREFQYVINDQLGIHARPAGMIARLAKQYQDTKIVIQKGEKMAEAAQLIRLMGLAVKHGDTVTVSAEGPEENAAIEALEKFFQENL